MKKLLTLTAVGWLSVVATGCNCFDHDWHLLPARREVARPYVCQPQIAMPTAQCQTCDPCAARPGQIMTDGYLPTPAVLPGPDAVIVPNR